jgi:cell wall-associated NlpC family hydrolase
VSLRAPLICIVALLVPALAASSDAQTLGDKIKGFFSTPTPTPSHHKKKSPPKESPTPSATPRKKRKASPTPAEEESPITSPKSKHKKKSSPTPEPTETPSPTPTSTPTPSPSETPTPSPEQKKRGAPNVTLTPDAIAGFEDYPAKVQKVLTSALELTTHNLDYKYGSADPDNGGMDCSGFVYFVLKQNGVDDVPRDSSGQYVWLRRAGTFESVLSRHDDSFEFKNLKPGDLLFWTGTYSIDRDPPITHAMFYLGREKKTGARVMVGASDGRTYQSQQRFGVSVFDFKLPRAEKGEVEDGKNHPRFVGYAHIPGLQE